MKKLLFVLFIIHSSFIIANSQSGWFQQLYGFGHGISSVYFSDQNNGWVTRYGTDGFTSQGDIMRTTNGGQNWSSSMWGSIAFTDVHFINSQTGWVIGNYGNDVGQRSRNIYKSTNGGGNYFLQYTDTLTGGFYKLFAMNINYIWVISLSVGNILKTSNSGANWSIQNLSAPLYDLFFINDQTGWILASLNRLYKTTNSGVNWNLINAPSGNSQECLFFINSSTGWLGSNNVYKTTNGGLNWNVVSPINITAKSIFFINELKGWVTGGNGTILATFNSGVNWTTQISGGNYSAITLNTIHFINDNTGWSGGTGPFYYPYYLGLVVKTTNGGVTPVQILSEEIPSSFALKQNYPNPFNPVTTIRFNIPATSLSFGEWLGVRLIIYDILGREVATLVHEQLKPGTYEIEWDGINYPSGVYYYKLTAGDYSETRKMVLIK